MILDLLERNDEFNSLHDDEAVFSCRFTFSYRDVSKVAQILLRAMKNPFETLVSCAKPYCWISHILVQPGVDVQ